MKHVASVFVLSMLLFIHVPASLLRAATRQLDAPLVIAHRGACGYLPEHTLLAVAMAHALGADFIEQDIVLSRDDQPIVIHDNILDYVTDVAKVFPDRKRKDGHYYVTDFTLAEIRALRVHERIDPITGKSPFPHRFTLYRGTFSLATLGEHIELIQGLNHTTGRNVALLVELKEPDWHRKEGKDLSRVVLDTLTRYGLKTHDDLAAIQTFDVDEVRRLRQELHTELRLVQLMNQDTFKIGSASHEQIVDIFDKLSDYADGIGPALEIMYSNDRIAGGPKANDVIELAHAAGLAVYGYTFRADLLPPGFTDLQQLVDLLSDAGLDGFITDHADKVRMLLPAPVR